MSTQTLKPRKAKSPLSTEAHNPFGFKYQDDQSLLSPETKQIVADTRAKTTPVTGPNEQMFSLKAPTLTARTKYQDKKSSGKFKDSSSSGEFSDQGTVNPQRQINPLKGTEVAASMVKPALDVANIASQYGLINKTHRQQQGRKIASYEAPQAVVQGAQDLPTEVLNQYERAAAGVRSQYSGSDPAMELISKQMAEGQRADIREKAATARGQHLANERRRVMQETAANQLRAAETANKNVDRQQQLADYKLGSDVNRTEQLRHLSSQALSQISKNLDTRAAYNTKKDLVEAQNDKAYTDSSLQYYLRKDEENAAAGLPAQYTDEIKRLSKQRELLQAEKLPSFDRSRAKWINFANGGKLIPR